tara:strand:- start:2364 stop:3224 length:861 start_codon:yes stop_codon:yes gene_type:complete
MDNKIISSIKYQLLISTKRNFSQKYIEKNIIPIIEFIIFSKKNKFLLSGSQGIGKSTLVTIIKYSLEKFYKKKIMILSLDNYYLSKLQRNKLAKSVHPLLLTRGVPGTHDIQRLKNDVIKFNKGKFPIYSPLFDKLSDDKVKKTNIIKKSDILILEGWCCGTNPLIKNYLYKNINNLETKQDSKKVWRNYYNHKLKTEYQPLFKMFDKIIFLKAPSFKYILDWRYKQEVMNKKKLTKNKKINKKNLIEFIMHYEKITKWMLQKMPIKASLLLKIDKKQKIISIIKN